MGWLASRTAEPERNATRVEPLGFAPVEVQVMGRGSLDILRARNVSTTGLGVFVPHGFEGLDLAEEVDLVVTLPSRKSFLARGVIKHVTSPSDDKNHFGLVFSQLEPDHRRSIERYVRSRRDQ